MSLKAALRNRPVIYEIVPPRRDTSRFHTELRGVDDVLHDSRIAAINVPELVNRRRENGRAVYSPATIPPEEYAMLIKEYKESIVDIIAPRLERSEFLRRTEKILREFQIPNLLIVGKEKHEDVLPGPGVIESLRLLSAVKGDRVALGGICIFNRESSMADGDRVISRLQEHRRVWLKAEAGCDFVTSQITFDPKSALDFLVSYQKLCEKTGRIPITVFVSLVTVPSPSILSLLDALDVVVPPKVRKKLMGSSDMGRESLKAATDVFSEIVSQADQQDIEIPLGLQIEQVGVNSGDLSLDLLDSVYPILRP